MWGARGLCSMSGTSTPVVIIWMFDDVELRARESRLRRDARGIVLLVVDDAVRLSPTEAFGRGS